MKHLSTAAALAAAFSLSGCASLDMPSQLTNRLMMSVGCDEMRVNSRWFDLFDIGTPVDKRDAEPILRTWCGGPAPAAAASGAK